MLKPPKAEEAERAVLGSMLIEPEAVDRAMHLLKAADFYEERHRVIFSVVADIWMAESVADYVTVSHTLNASGRLDDCGGAAYLSELMKSVSSAAHVEHYARLVKAASIRRQILLQLTSAQEVVVSGNYPAEQVQELGGLIMAGSGNSAARMFDLREDLPGVVKEILRRDVPSVNTGFKNLDSILNGLLPSELITVGGRTGTGKTAFMLRTCIQMAQDSHECLYITSEMRIRDIVARMLPQATGISSWKFRKRLMSHEEVDTVHSVGIDNLSSLPIRIVDRPRISIENIRAAVVASGCKVVFVDHLQRCRLGEAEKESTAIYDFMADFKELLLDTGAIGFMGCQLDRERDTKNGQRPLLKDFRGSSGIESESNIALLLWRPGKDYIEKRPGYVPAPEGVVRAECYVAKSREGQSDIGVFMDFQRDIVKFVESEMGIDGREGWS